MKASEAKRISTNKRTAEATAKEQADKKAYADGEKDAKSDYNEILAKVYTEIERAAKSGSSYATYGIQHYISGNERGAYGYIHYMLSHLRKQLEADDYKVTHRIDDDASISDGYPRDDAKTVFLNLSIEW